MITNLFSTFDPCTGIFSINWIRILIILIIIPNNFWILNNKTTIIYKILLITIYKEIKTLIKNKRSTLIIISIFILIIINNIIGLIPYIFTASSHLSFSLSIAMPIWTSLILFGWIKKTNKIFKHIIPSGTPNLLIPFIVLIETIRNIIRPGSLAVRLSANIIAGHLLITLLGNNIKSIKIIIITIIITIILILFETAVSIIQSYVFITLSTLYSREI